MTYGLRVVTPPACEPVTLQEAREQLRLQSTAEDGHVERLIQVAREWCERYTGRSFIQTTWRMTLDRFPPVIRLPRPELRSVTSVLYDDAAGAEQTLATDQYVVDGSNDVARITPAYGATWPSTYPQTGAVRVTFVSGYADDGTSPVTNESLRANVPESVKQAVLVMVTEMFERRTQTITGTIIQPVQLTIEALLWPHRHMVMD